MAWQTGTAAGHIDLLDKLVTFLSTDANLVSASQNWEVLRPPSALPQTAEAVNGRIAFSTRGSTIAPDPLPDALPLNSPWRLQIDAVLDAPSDGTYQLGFYHEDWIEVTLDGALVIANYSANASTTSFPSSGASYVSLTLTEGAHDLRIKLISRQIQVNPNRGVSFGWRKPGDGSISIVPATNLSNISLIWGYLYSSPLIGTAGTPAEMLAAMSDVDCSLKGPGLSGTDEVFLNFNTLSGVSSDTFNLACRGSLAYDPAASAAGNPSTSPASSGTIPLWEDPIPYWFVANGRRVIVIAKISTNYESLYAGLGLPAGTPSEYPYMLVIGGSSATQTSRFSVTGTSRSSFWRPSYTGAGSNVQGALSVRTTAGVWQQFSSLGGVPGLVYPINEIEPEEERPAPNSSYLLQPFVLYLPGVEIYGEFDGVFFVTGFGNASENLITINSDDYLVVQSSYRTDANSYAAIKLA